MNGNFQVTQREVADTTKSTPDTQETKTTLYRADGNGGFTALRETHELEKRGIDNSVEVKKTMLIPDGNGGLQVAEVKEQTIKEAGKKRTTEERISRPDINGKLSELFRTVGQETQTATGEKTSTVDTYSSQLPGSAGNGTLQLNRRVSTIQRKDSNGEITEQQINSLIWATLAMRCKPGRKRNTSCSMRRPGHNRPKPPRSLTAPENLPLSLPKLSSQTATASARKTRR